MRSVRCMRRAALGAASGGAATAPSADTAKPATTASASGSDSSKKGGVGGVPPPASSVDTAGRTTGPAKTWRTMTFKSWQLRTVEDAGDRSSMPTTVLYHGDQLGPRPLVILDHSVARSEYSGTTIVDAYLEAAKKYEAMLSSLAWDYGAVYVPLPVSIGEVNVMEQSCRHVCAVLDALDVQWSHVLAHSYGALVAARMAASTAYPHRIGSLVLLDTPLVTEQLVRNTKQREEIAKAREDVNVPPAELSFAIESLRSALETTLPYPAAADKSLYENHLFSSDSLFREKGLVRDEHRYVPVRHLAQVHHPLQLLVPVKQPITDVEIHKEFFGLRRPAAIKTADNHEEMFSAKCADEVADVVRAWMQRFEPDVVMKRRFEKAAKEMTQLMSSNVALGEKSGGVTEKKRDRKEKKKGKH
ncbi:hypothetical protein LSCM4_06909 [Leishmania orientalis]|uniref:AB hydrolase-1 domain-containing protein n=1 Tax=Leishmania orientalis TaxID=2249476 RepID=A0A836HIC2_9TRYP|nr:hypothetical protein LSCM4_06909 [Leishmania orientalis]